MLLDKIDEADFLLCAFSHLASTGFVSFSAKIELGSNWDQDYKTFLPQLMSTKIIVIFWCTLYLYSYNI